MEETIINPNGTYGGSKKKHTFWVNCPHEGPKEYEFEYTCVTFTDGISRFIFTSDIVPKDYWPRMAYVCNFITGEYEYVGSYEIKEGYVFIEPKS